MKNVMVRIKSNQISEEAGEDQMEFVTEAELYSKNGTLYLIYEESEFSGMPGCKTRLRLRDGEVQLKRFGEGAGGGSELKFTKGKRYSGLYETPFGPIEMELLTNDIRNTISEEGDGQVDIDYQISLKGLLEARNRMNITLM